MAKYSLFNHKLKYFVDEKKGVVTCHLLDSGDYFNPEMAWNEFLKDAGLTIFQDYDIFNAADNVESAAREKVCKMYPKKFGRVKCDAEDTFDVETGKRLACDRLFKKLERARKLYIKLCFDELVRKIDGAYRRAGKRHCAPSIYPY